MKEFICLCLRILSTLQGIYGCAENWRLERERERERERNKFFLVWLYSYLCHGRNAPSRFPGDSAINTAVRRRRRKKKRRSRRDAEKTGKENGRGIDRRVLPEILEKQSVAEAVHSDYQC